MKPICYTITVFLFVTASLFSQSNINYEISFKNAVHHEAEISVEYRDVDSDTLSVRMSRTSPGRYAIHEFAKNVYGFKAFDETGNALRITRPKPYQWDISGHQGFVKVSYILFANHGDGTYSQVDETHAHLNIPATFMYAPYYNNRPIKIKFYPREDLNWKVATQLKLLSENTYFAPDLDYFMDSPTEISNHQLKSFTVQDQGKNYDINFVLHQADDYEGFDTYFENVKKIVESEINVFGDLPDFDFGSYTFLSCYMENVNGDGMEHRNSTVLTSLKSLQKGGAANNIGTVAHEFFHAWNVERIRPESLKPFDYTEANMSGELWFAEGFTSYYTNLILCRTEIISREAYTESLSKLLSYVWNSPGRNYNNPIQMSYQAPFVDAATSVDQVNWENTFISYYSYGHALGLALDLSLRNLEEDKTLDGYMKLVWQNYGKNETPYTLKNLEDTLSDYAGGMFSQQFFKTYIYQSGMPDYKNLLAAVGIDFSNQSETLPSFGANIVNKNNKWLVNSNPQKESSFYNAGLSKGDEIISIDGKLTNNKLKPNEFLKSYKAGETVKVVFNRFENQYESEIVFMRDPAFKTTLTEKPSKKVQQKQDKWLGSNRK
ncbi:MAG: M61 family metallopeptidase [Flavobacteriales bacterium]|nr:M61 family metallopeptidase [Flavobacteriales bacterium]